MKIEVGRKHYPYIHGVRISLLTNSAGRTYPNQRFLGIEIHNGAYTRSLHVRISIIFIQLGIDIGKV